MNRMLVMLFAVVAMLFVVSTSFAGVELYRLDVGVAFTPPHNEPIVQDSVARYKLEGNVGVKYWRFTFDFNAKVWGLQDWRTPDQVGHGFPDAWSGSDWAVRSVRVDHNYQVGFNIVPKLQIYIEHNQYNYLKGAPSTHPAEYYWMAGLKYRYK